MEQVKLIPLELHTSERRGNISVLEDLPFKVKRIFCIYNVPVEEVRGGHAHKKCRQIFVAVSGAVLVKVVGNRDYILDCPDMGLFIPPQYTVHLHFLDENAALLVLASERYDENDYVYSEG